MRETDVPIATSVCLWSNPGACFIYGTGLLKGRKNSNDKTSKITYTAIFAAIATVLMYFEFPIPFMPPFLKVDLSGAVVLIGAFIFGIAPAITMIGIKDIIHLTQTQTGGSGEVADFLMLSTLVVIAVLLYRGHKSRKMAVLGCAAGSVAMACVGMLTNYFLIIPFYSQVMPLQAIFDVVQCYQPVCDRHAGLSAAWRSAVQSHQRRNSDCDYHARLQKSERVHQVQADRTAPLQNSVSDK